MFNQTDHLWGTSRASDGPKIMARGEGGEKLGEGRCFGEFFVSFRTSLLSSNRSLQRGYRRANIHPFELRWDAVPLAWRSPLCSFAGSATYLYQVSLPYLTE